VVASKKELALTLEQVEALLELRLPESVFYWRVRPSLRSRVRAGSKAGYLTKDGYIEIRINGGNFRSHRLVWFVTYGKFPDNHIDHIDGNPSNNKIENLRDVTNKVNHQNMSKQNRRDTDLPTGVKAMRNKYDAIRGYEAYWCDINGNRCYAYFGIREWLTLEAALAAAVARRELEMANLKLLGAAYTERHGKQDGQL
jgi:hypothetical protein